MPVHKPMKDRLTLFFCANASEDLKVKPLLVYHSENPWAFKKCKVQKTQLNVMWRSNSKAWITRILFVEWINKVFSPAVKKYLAENNLPLKVLLVMDNAPAHPPGLEDLLEGFKFIKVNFLPPNTTPLNGSACHFELQEALHQSTISAMLRSDRRKKSYPPRVLKKSFPYHELPQDHR